MDGLLAWACPSIQYRLRRDILRQPPQSDEMRGLQARILQADRVREVIGWRQDDGWLAWDFHGSHSIEAGVRILCEMGVERENPALDGALRALGAHDDRLERGIGKVGAILDDLGLGGSRMIRAAVFAYAGVEDLPCVTKQIAIALDGFQAVLDIGGVEGIVEEYKGKLVFKPGVTWPSVYHLRLLAFTHSWRTPHNLAMLARAIGRLIEWSPLPDIKARHKSQLIAPASFGMHDFNPALDTLDPAGWMMWFHRMELLSQLGIAGFVPELRAQAERLQEMLDASDGRFTAPLNHPYFKNWGAYTGLMLEPDWKSPGRRINDLTFRSLLILAGANIT